MVRTEKGPRRIIGKKDKSMEHECNASLSFAEVAFSNKVGSFLLSGQVFNQIYRRTAAY